MGLKGLLAASIMAMVMSTADSCLHAATVLCGHDLGTLLAVKEKK